MTAHAAAIDAEQSDYIFEHNGVVVIDSGTFNSNTFVKTIVMETLGLSSMIGYLPPDPNGYWPGIGEWYALQPAAGYTIDGYVYKLGTAANDTITAPNASNHLIDGGDGVDTILGGAGNDIIWGGSSGDTLGGGNGNDTIHGNDGIDTINGGDGSDTADYSTALGGISVDLDAGEASADGDAVLIH
jgi:Ca2+-binding RTX toxin-like protein